ncbi:MAG: T9SS type A sorting domain-containing protein [Chitinophagaceae bacterium]|nr:T9SS type A sorting domain-containing protein [Chitinophagaceae bacterium]MCW5904151.1 T9SS type A sorting domain-containing protein [Chitinophagaceae bacterium]
MELHGVNWGGANSLQANNTIYALCSDATGNIYTAGFFTNSNFRFYVAKFNGSTWSELGGTNSFVMNSVIAELCSDAAGNIYATVLTNLHYVVKFNGTAWNELGGTNSLQANWYIFALYSDIAGNIYAGGEFTNANSNYYVAKFNGSVWSELGGTNSLQANSYIWSFCSDMSGNIYVAGNFTNGNGKRYVAKFNGSTWSELGGTNSLQANDGITSICTDAAGNIYAAGRFTNANGKQYVAKFNGSTWSELGGENSLEANAQISSICSDAVGNIYAAGHFTNSNGNRYVAKYTNSAVPLIYTNFTATLQNKNVSLQWQTANEINVSYFNVQRSGNGTDFYAINKVNAKNESYNEYSITDVQPLNGRSYYRIEAVDKDGKITYSKIENIQYSTFNTQLSIYPNPAKDVLNIQYSNIKEVSIIDLTGRRLLNKNYDDLTFVQLNIATLSKGIYFVKVTNTEGNTQTQKLVVE